MINGEVWETGNYDKWGALTVQSPDGLPAMTGSGGLVLMMRSGGLVSDDALKMTAFRKDNKGQRK